MGGVHEGEDEKAEDGDTSEAVEEDENTSEEAGEVGKMGAELMSADFLIVFDAELDASDCFEEERTVSVSRSKVIEGLRGAQLNSKISVARTATSFDNSEKNGAENAPHSCLKAEMLSSTLRLRSRTK